MYDQPIAYKQNLARRSHPCSTNLEVAVSTHLKMSGVYWGNVSSQTGGSHIKLAEKGNGSNASNLVQAPNCSLEDFNQNNKL